MKKLVTLCVLSLALFSMKEAQAAQTDNSIRIVNLQTCLDASKRGKTELKRFDAMKKKFEDSITQKEKKLKELSPKFTEEYLDSISPEEEKKLKDEFQKLSQELSQEQSDCYQILNRTQMEILQGMQDLVTQAAKAIAKEKSIRLILRQDACLFSDEVFDLTPDIVTWIDAHDAKAEDEKK